MSDTITKNCNKCEEDFDFLPQAGMKVECDSCIEEDERYFSERETLASAVNKTFVAYKKLIKIMDNVYGNLETNNRTSNK